MQCIFSIGSITGDSQTHRPDGTAVGSHQLGKHAFLRHTLDERAPLRRRPQPRWTTGNHPAGAPTRDPRDEIPTR